MRGLLIVPADSWRGRLLRLPTRLIPASAVVRIRSGVNRGRRWVYGSGNLAFWLGTYEEDKQESLGTLIKPGMVIWDVGANIGFYTLAFSQLTSPGGFVYAFEPLGTNFGRLLAHIRLNHLDNVTAVQGALSNADGLMGFDTGPNSLMGRLDANLKQYLLPTLTADGFLARYPQAAPDLIKIDVEGAEGAVLEGAKNLLSTHGPVLLLALHGPEAERQCHALLTELGYACYYLDGTPALKIPFREEEILARPIKKPGQ